MSRQIAASMVRRGGEHMPSFGAAAIGDRALVELAGDIHDSLGQGSSLELIGFGAPTLDPMRVGGYTWMALFFLCAVCAALFGLARN